MLAVRRRPMLARRMGCKPNMLVIHRRPMLGLPAQRTYPCKIARVPQAAIALGSASPMQLRRKASNINSDQIGTL